MRVQRPHDKKHIALAFSSFTNDQYKDIAYKELIDNISDNSFNLQYTYGIYTDHFMVKENIFLPIFHIYYLNSSKKSVILRQEECYDLPIIYPHHDYYIYNESNNHEQICDNLKQISGISNIYIINSIKDIK